MVTSSPTRNPPVSRAVFHVKPEVLSVDLCASWHAYPRVAPWIRVQWALLSGELADVRNNNPNLGFPSVKKILPQHFLLAL